MRHAPKNTQPLDALYAFVSVDEGGEGALAEINLATGLARPLICGGSNTVLEAMRKAAEDIARRSGKKVQLVKFQRVDEFPLWSFDPRN